MDFTVLGSAHVAAGGHPDLKQLRHLHRPSLLGLLEGTDRGRTWQTPFLLGKTDLYSRHAAHGGIYGRRSVPCTLWHPVRGTYEKLSSDVLCFDSDLSI